MTRGQRYLVLETQNFAPGEGDYPRTSFLRIGGVPNHERVQDAATMRSLTPAAGAVTAAAGAGEDLAARVTAFTDDDRDRCFPPELDANLEATNEVAFENALYAQRRKLREAQDHLGAIDDVLLAVVADPEGWLASLYQRAMAADKRVAELEKVYAKASAEREIEQKKKRELRAPPAFCPDYVPIAEREAESARLHKKGGWRDHTDGNRIITTRGDKIEVVRGNYRMVVLGRYREPKNAAEQQVLPGFDASGGHIHEQSIVVAQQTDVEWKRRQNGTWHTRETTTKSDTKALITGDSESQAYGHYRRSSVGSENPHPWHEPEGCSDNDCRPNPKIINQVFASEMFTQTGSAAWWIPKLQDTTWAKTVSSETHADTMTDDTEVAHIKTRTTVDGEMKTSTTASTMSTVTRASVINDDISNMMMLSLTLGDSFTTTFGMQQSVTLGTTTDVVLGAELNITAIESTDISIGASLDLFAGAKADLKLEGTVSVTLGMTISTNSAMQVLLSAYFYKHVVPALSIKAPLMMVG